MASSDEIKKLNEEIKNLQRELGKTSNFKIFKASDMKDAQTFLKGLQVQVSDLGNDLSTLAGIFAGNLQDITKTDIALNNTKSSLRSLNTLASNLASTYNDISLVSSKDIDFTEKRIKQDLMRLKLASETLDKTSDEFKANQDGIKQATIFLEKVKDIRKEQDAIMSNKGVKGFTVLSDIVKSIPGLSGLSGPFEAAATAAQNTAKLNNQMFKGMDEQQIKEKLANNKEHNEKLARAQELIDSGVDEETAVASEGLSMDDLNTGALPEEVLSPLMEGFKALTDGIGQLAKTALIFKFFTDALMEANEQATYMQKTLLMTNREAILFRTELSNAAMESQNINVTTSKMLATYQAITEQFGFIAGLSAETLAISTKLTEQIGLEAEAAGSLAMLAASTGGDLDDQYKSALLVSHEMQVQEGVQFDLRKLLEETAAITGVMRAQLGASTEAMIEAVTQAKLLGGSLDDVAGAGAAMLDFEQSIANELQAELLLNKDLNLEKARQAALNGDLATLGKELKEQAGDFEEFSAMNVIQQEALAEAMGMQADQLADILFQQDIQGKTAKELRAMGKDDLAAQLEQQTAADEFNATIDKLKDILVDVFAALEPILGIFTGIANIVAFILSPLTALLNWANSFNSVMGIVVSLLTAAGIAALFLNGTLTMGVGVAIALAAIAGGMAYFNSEMNKADDLLSAGDGTNGYGKRTLLGPEGAIALNNKDTIVAGTDLFSKGDDVVSAGAGKVQMGNDNKETNMLLRTLVTQNKKKPSLSPVGLYEIQ